MSRIGSPAVGVSRGLSRLDLGNLDVHGAALSAAIVVAPLLVGFGLGLAEATVLVMIGALNLLLVKEPFPAKTRGRVLRAAAATNALA